MLEPIAFSEEASTLLQGFGTVGSWLAELLALRGCKVLAVSDRNGAVFKAGGLDIRALRRHVKAKPPFGGSLLSYPGGELGDEQITSALLRGQGVPDGRCMFWVSAGYDEPCVLHQAPSATHKWCAFMLLPADVVHPPIQSCLLPTAG